MDKRRSDGSSRERSTATKNTTKRIGNDDAFLDASRDPRLNNDKYRAQMMNKKTRVSPDTTMVSKKVLKKESEIKKEPGQPDRVQSGLSKKKDKDVYFRCAMSPDKLFDTIEEVRQYIKEEHSIDVPEIVNKLIKLPSVKNLCVYKSTISDYTAIGATEDELKAHFKQKHNMSKVLPVLIKRICRIDGYDKAKSNAELFKYIEDNYPRADFADDESENDDGEEMGGSPEASPANDDEDEPYEPEEELDYEPKPESPEPRKMSLGSTKEIFNNVWDNQRSRDSSGDHEPSKRSRDSSRAGAYEASKRSRDSSRDYEESQEDGELSADDNRASRKRSRSASSNSSKSSHKSKKKHKKSKKSKKYRQPSSSSSSDDSRSRQRENSVSPSTSKRKVYMKEEKKAKKASSPAPVPERYAEKKEKKEVFGLYYTPPGGYCEECNASGQLWAGNNRKNR